MRLEHYPLSKLKKEILKIFSQYLNLSLYRVFFFGSRVTGRGNERSDIDIGLEGPAEIPPAALARIREEVEALPLLYKIEIVDFKRVAPAFRQTALQKIEFIK